MEPELHRSYSAEEAVAAFGGGPAESFCDGQFIVLPGAVLGFVTVGDAESEPSVDAPCDVRWRPGRLDYDPTDREHPWLPRAVRDVYLRDRGAVEKIRDHHVFIRAPGDRAFLYADPAHLGSYGDGRGDFSADFTLDHRLPLNLWLRLGGYRGWLVEVDHDPVRVDADDRETFRHLLARIRRREFSHLAMTRYEGDELSVYTNPDRGWLMYLRAPGDPGLYVRDPAFAGDPGAREGFFCTCGIDLDFPISQTLPLDQALRVAGEFFDSGELPGWLAWSPEGE